jgi:putative DNA primase/helicase
MKRQEAANRLLHIAGVPDERITLMAKFSPVPYAEKMMGETKFLYDNYKRFWRFDNTEGIWKEDAEMFIKNKLRTSLMGEEQQKINYMIEVVSYIKDVCWSERDITNPPENIIAFQNCLFDINTEEIIDFDFKYFITIKIPITIDSMYQECDKIDQFFEDVVGRENKIILYELMAYSMLRCYPYQKFFILYGKGCNGKSVFLNLIRKFLGMRNVSNETPQLLVNNKFSKGNLWNKLSNVSSDIPYISIENTNTLKELTGEDYTNCERKFREPFPFKNHAKLIFSANELPQINDKTYAFYRRVYIIRFENAIKNPDPFILEKISNSEELSGLGWQLIKILKKMKGRDYKFSLDPSIKKMEEMYEDLSNPLNKFLREMTTVNDTSNITKWEFKDKFTNWLRENGFRIWGEREINVIMRERYREGKVEVKNDNPFNSETKWHRCWEGIGLNVKNQ